MYCFYSAGRCDVRARCRSSTRCDRDIHTPSRSSLPPDRSDTCTHPAPCTCRGRAGSLACTPAGTDAPAADCEQTKQKSRHSMQSSNHGSSSTAMRYNSRHGTRVAKTTGFRIFWRNRFRRCWSYRFPTFLESQGSNVVGVTGFNEDVIEMLRVII